MTDNEINLSKEKVTGSRGAMLVPGPSTVKAGTTLAPIANVAPPNASAAPGDWQTRKVDATPITPHNGMKSRTVNDGSPGGVLGGKPVRPVTR